MRLNRKALMGTVAAVALAGYAIGVPTEANAFDNTNWTWTLTNNTTINETINISVDIDPIGKVLDEVLQIQIGDVTAVSNVSGVYNWKPLSEQVVGVIGYSRDKTVSVDGNYSYDVSGHGSQGVIGGSFNTTTNSFQANLNGSLETEGSGIPFFIGGAGAIGGYFTSPGPDGAAGAGVIGAIGAYATDGDASFDANLGGSLTQGTSSFGGEWSKYWYSHKGSGVFAGDLHFTDTDITRIYGLAPAIQDAELELPVVKSTAIAIGNSISIEADTAVQEHSLQVVADTHCRFTDCHNPDFYDADFKLDAAFFVNGSPVNVDSGNYMHDVALLTTLSAGAGLLKKADITATSTVNDILNASVESDATAIGNIKSISVETTNPVNGLVVADISQVSIADVSAYSNVGGGLQALTVCDGPCGYPGGGINLINYTNLGGLPIVTSNATAIGNVLNVKVNSAQNAVTAP